jgi:hypothetical protein
MSSGRFTGMAARIEATVELGWRCRRLATIAFASSVRPTSANAATLHRIALK